MFPPKTKAAQEFEYCGKLGFVWVLFWERNTCGWMRDSSGGEGRRQHVGNRQQRVAAAQQSCADACPGRSLRGQRAGWERSAAVRSCLWLFVSYCVYESRLSILFYIKRIASKMLVSAINIFTWKKLKSTNFVQLEWCAIAFILMSHVF